MFMHSISDEFFSVAWDYACEQCERYEGCFDLYLDGFLNYKYI